MEGPKVEQNNRQRPFSELGRKKLMSILTTLTRDSRRFCKAYCPKRDSNGGECRGRNALLSQACTARLNNAKDRAESQTNRNEGLIAAMERQLGRNKRRFGILQALKDKSAEGEVA